MTGTMIMSMLAGKLIPMMEEITTEALQEDLAAVLSNIQFTINNNMELEVEI